jgi:Zn-dependent protease
MTNLPPDAVTRAWVAFAGPLIGGVCSAAMYWGGGQLNNGWLMAAGSFGFMLNLLQLIPAKPLDGGFVVLAISRWLILPGSILLCAVALMFHSILFGIIGIFSLFKAIKQLFGKETIDENVIAATTPQRLTIGIAYLALAGMLGYLYTLSQTTVMDVVRRDPRGRQAIQQIAPNQHQSKSGAYEQDSDSDESDQNNQPLDQQSDKQSQK